MLQVSLKNLLHHTRFEISRFLSLHMCCHYEYPRYYGHRFTLLTAVFPPKIHQNYYVCAINLELPCPLVLIRCTFSFLACHSCGTKINPKSSHLLRIGLKQPNPIIYNIKFCSNNDQKSMEKYNFYT